MSGLGHGLWGRFRRQRELRREAEVEAELVAVKRAMHRACICDGIPGLSCDVAADECAYRHHVCEDARVYPRPATMTTTILVELENEITPPRWPRG